MKNLQLSLIRKWFEMTDAKVKKEDYRSITHYWCSRFIKDFKEYDEDTRNEIVSDLNHPFTSIEEAIEYYRITFVKFDYNKMTLGYPSKTDLSRIRKYKHEGIEIRTGNPEWRAEPNKIYFVIKHGEEVEL
jgi:hypothetical protein